MIDYRIKMTLTILSPTLSQSMEGKKLGIDTSFEKIVDDKLISFPVLPASLIRGNLLHSWKQLTIITDSKWISEREISTLLGSEAESDSYTPNYATLRMSDSWIAEKPIDEYKLHRITINPDTGTVKKGMLQILEIPHPVGEEINYSGFFEISLANKEDAEFLSKKIEKAFKLMPALGAFKGIGFGKICSVKITPPECIKPEIAIMIEADEFGLEIALDRAFCFAKPHHEKSNLFSSLDFIPGGAIKGAIARRILQLGSPRDFQCITQQLSLIRFTHAQPDTFVGKRTRRSQIPLSLVYSENTFSDAAFKTLDETKEIKFQTDWKNPQWAIVTEKFRGKNVPALEHELRVRTKINSEHNSAEDEVLFSIESIKADKHVWRSNVSFINIKKTEEREAVREALSKLFTLGLNGLGKTRACTKSIKINKPSPFTIDSHQLIENGEVRLVLQTDTLLLPNDLKILPTNNGDELKKEYIKAWNKIINEKEKIFELTDYFTTQRLFGGDYFWRRFQNKAEVYKPYLLTEAGSVFVFNVINEEKANIILENWLHQGLPVPSYYPNNRENNPILPENGYGEIQLNQKTKVLCNQLNAKQLGN